MTTQLLNVGTTLMLVGMGVVFVFLTVLVVATTLMSRLVMRFQPVTDSNIVEQEEIAAITAAIARHRRR